MQVELAAHPEQAECWVAGAVPDRLVHAGLQHMQHSTPGTLVCNLGAGCRGCCCPCAAAPALLLASCVRKANQACCCCTWLSCIAACTWPATPSSQAVVWLKLGQQEGLHHITLIAPPLHAHNCGPCSSQGDGRLVRLSLAACSLQKHMPPSMPATT